MNSDDDEFTKESSEEDGTSDTESNAENGGGDSDHIQDDENVALTSKTEPKAKRRKFSSFNWHRETSNQLVGSPKWLLQIERYLKDKELFTSLEDPTRVFNGDERTY
jgi:hypothetical protein